MRLRWPLSIRKNAIDEGSDAPSSDVLFDGDDALFKTLVSQAQTYGEYGMGDSTLWSLSHSAANVRAVDTSAEWVARIEENCAAPSRLEAIWVDVGAVGDWGRPVSYRRRKAFPSYVESLWSDSFDPDVVLIDGRFRVACFLHSIARATSGTKIIFDDYNDRPHYHIVETLLKPIEKCGRQSLFVVPDKIDKPAALELRNQFLMVMD